MKKQKIGVIIGRFQGGPHYGHDHMFNMAMSECDHVIVLIGSANSYQNFYNPFTYEQREEVISKYLLNRWPQTKWSILPLDDYKYNDARWFSDVYRKVSTKTHGMAKFGVKADVHVYGHYKDSESFWLKMFPSWKLREVPASAPCQGCKPFHSSDIRKLYFLNRETSTDLVVEAREALNKFSTTKEYERLADEYKYWNKELEKYNSYPYPGHIHAPCADSLVVCSGYVLLIKRKFCPGKGAWALPGGHKGDDETFKDAAIRELREEVKLKVPEPVLRGSIKGEKLFDSVRRAGPINKPTLVQYIEIMPDHDGSLPKIAGAASDAAEAMWVPLYQLNTDFYGRLHDDHKCIINYFLGI